MGHVSDSQMLRVSEPSVSTGKAFVSLKKHKEFLIMAYGLLTFCSKVLKKKKKEKKRKVKRPSTAKLKETWEAIGGNDVVTSPASKTCVKTTEPHIYLL